jgi:hypothetical protein
MDRQSMELASSQTFVSPFSCDYFFFPFFFSPRGFFAHISMDARQYALLHKAIQENDIQQVLKIDTHYWNWPMGKNRDAFTRVARENRVNLFIAMSQENPNFAIDCYVTDAIVGDSVLILKYIFAHSSEHLQTFWKQNMVKVAIMNSAFKCLKFLMKDDRILSYRINCNPCYVRNSLMMQKLINYKIPFDTWKPASQLDHFLVFKHFCEKVPEFSWNNELSQEIALLFQGKKLLSTTNKLFDIISKLILNRVVEESFEKNIILSICYFALGFLISTHIATSCITKLILDYISMDRFVKKPKRRSRFLIRLKMIKN